MFCMFTLWLSFSVNSYIMRISALVTIWTLALYARQLVIAALLSWVDRTLINRLHLYCFKLTVFTGSILCPCSRFLFSGTVSPKGLLFLQNRHVTGADKQNIHYWVLIVAYRFFARDLGPQLTSGFSWNRSILFCRETGLASGLIWKLAWILEKHQMRQVQ